MARAKAWLCISGWLLISWSTIRAQNPDIVSAYTPESANVRLIAQKEPVGGKKEDPKKETKPPVVDFSALPTDTAETPTGRNPHMIGDFGGLCRMVTVTIPTFATIRVPNPDGIDQIIKVPTTVQRTICIPSAGRGGFKIGENEGVLPQDRAYFSYNFFNNFQAPADGSDRPFFATQNFTVGGQTLPGQVLVPGFAPPRFDVHRQTLGFEKSVLDGDFSVGVRVPMFQQNGAAEFADRDLGDLTFVFKYGAVRNLDTGSGVSVGLAVTVPTGPDVELADGDLNSWLLQPFLGYQFNGDRLLLYGFTSIVVPTDNRDVTLLFNDLGLGIRMFEGDGIIRSLIPAIEAHVTTPLDHRAPGSEIQGLDLVVLTGGVHIGLGDLSLLTLGLATPVTGPRPFEIEAIVQFNFRF